LFVGSTKGGLGGVSGIGMPVDGGPVVVGRFFF
jgi:hypothetical protein